MAGTDSGHVMAESGAAADGLERKLATILSADVASYSRLMAQDEERTLQTFRAHKEVFGKLVQLHRGRVFNTAGDAILAEFGSAVEAVRCATEIQAAPSDAQRSAPERAPSELPHRRKSRRCDGAGRGFAWRRRQCRGAFARGGRAGRYLHFRQRIRPGPEQAVLVVQAAG